MKRKKKKWKGVSLVSQTVNNLPAMWETLVWPLGREDPLQKEIITHFSILAWRIPWREELGGLQSMGSQRVGHDWATELNWYVKEVCVCVQLLSCVQLFATPWTVAHQVPLSMGFPRQEFWSGLPIPNPDDLPNPGIKLASLASPALAAGFLTTSNTWEIKWKLPSCIRLFSTPWTVVRQAILSMEFSRQEYWSGLPFPSPGDLPDPGIEPGSPALQADSLLSELSAPPGRYVKEGKQLNKW